ncbi:MAG: FAD-dependent oxidoreductase [Nocardioidaceae bacterium]|nr:FAD-dependent oxidoreductase [Nocardioidaceae bacterium]
MRRQRVAVVGGGVAGLTAAYVISAHADVTLLEADARLGGHADTHDVGGIAVDTGFIVHNERTYPTLCRLFGELGVRTQPAEMSMSFRSGSLEWAGARGLPGLFPSWRSLLRPRYLRMLTEIPRFHRRAQALLATEDDRTLGAFLDDAGFSAFFRQHFAEPLVATVWSCEPAVALDYPARYLFRFLDHHGMLGVLGSPRWRTVTGGSRSYVDRLAAVLATRGAEVLTDTKVTAVAEEADGVSVTDGNGRVTRYDAVVLAVHPDQALSMLASPTPVQRDVLGAMPYSRNLAQLHTDTALLPRHRRAWASWNQLARPGGVTVTYDLTRLMRLPSYDGTRYLVTLNAPDLVDPETVIATRDYAHPIYTPASVAAQRRLPEIETRRLVFAGAWHGWGFHEDGARSGVAAATRLGFPWPGPPRTPAVYASTITHARRTPWRRRFTHRSHLWLVDLDDLPDHGVLGRFEARDHLGDPARSLRANVDAFLAREGIVATRVLMAANARALGYCFNPISVFWCFDGTGGLAATVLEVHNTYGDRHAYLVHPDERGRALVPKEMYVSPFHGVDGHYELVVPVPGERLRVCVRLVTDDGEVFDATLDGRRTETHPLRTAPAAARGALLIRLHGLALWARRLPLRPRPPHHQEGVR